ncbi:TlyA family RNA methyltransferase [Gryllotalpicola protaetiae]|uniref:TlyA family RNA methyltransferase n=1 Tax=Gryllotalpicola protaetiae TaxID=2419771 RepID=A0A387BR59_9MICO|nr:TlyA family RNA methyltransferase [Gryllotalpicola protaetiae]AYG04574.1 TlyA family RNA methyltransferase [Gryllotalpicola protaetiae]
MPSTRLDAAVVARRLARSRTAAAKLIADGRVTVDGKPVVKASAQVDDASAIVVALPDHYVSRGAHKLIAALDAFDVDPSGRLALDLGASTGGFTQVLLERGARHVLAVDVGHGQLSVPVKGDPRVSDLEGVNARYLTATRLAEASGISESPDLVVGDLSFISLTHVLPAARETATRDADFVVLIKPQFEVGRTGVKEGIVRDPVLRADAVAGVLWAAWDLGLGIAGLTPSPIAGTYGNREYVCWMSAARGTNPTEWVDRVSTMTGA